MHLLQEEVCDTVSNRPSTDKGTARQQAYERHDNVAGKRSSGCGWKGWRWSKRSPDTAMPGPRNSATMLKPHHSAIECSARLTTRRRPAFLPLHGLFRLLPLFSLFAQGFILPGSEPQGTYYSRASKATMSEAWSRRLAHSPILSAFQVSLLSAPNRRRMATIPRYRILATKRPQQTA